MDNDELLIAIKDMFEKKVDEVKVLVENLENKIQIVAKDHGNLDRKFDEVIEDLSKKIDSVDMKVDDIKNDISVVKKYIIGVDEKLNEHEVTLKRVK